MYKFASHLSNDKLILVRSKLRDGSTTALIFMREPRRNLASAKPNDPCKAPPAHKSSRIFWSLVGATVITGAACVYAKNSRPTRSWLESNLPIADAFINVVYQEKQSYGEFANTQLTRFIVYIREFVFGKEGVTPSEIPSRSAQDIEKEAKEHYENKKYILPPPLLEPLYVPEKIIDPPSVETNATMVTTDKCEVPKRKPIKITKDLVELEKDMLENTKQAIEKYRDAKKFSVTYNAALSKIIESDIDDLSKNTFAALKGAQGNRDSTFNAAKEAGTKARCAIETLERAISEGIDAPPENVTATLRHLKKIREDLFKAEKEYEIELQNSDIRHRYWEKVQESRKMFKDELEALFPGIDLEAKQLTLKGGDPDLLLTHTLKRIQMLQNEIAKLQTVKEQEINRAIACNDKDALMEAKVEQMLLQERIKKDREFLTKSLQMKAEAARRLDDLLKKQYEVQQKTLEKAEAAKEAQIMNKINRVASERILAEQTQFKKDLAAMAGKLQAYEQTLKKRASAEAEARRSQSLWMAAEALLAATKRPGQITKIQSELDALKKAGQHDQLVQTILKGIPEKARNEGIVTEKALRDRFDTMEENAKKVALIGREGASLPVYFLSWVQSKLIFSQFAEIPYDELNNQPTDFTKFDTFDIMQRARYHMDKGDMGASLRYVNLLQGAARAAAQGWADAARAHLEVRQAAEAVMTHASVNGMLYM